MLTKQEIYQALRDHQERLVNMGVNRIGLFGSFVRDAANSESDIDLLIEFQVAQKSFEHFMELSFFLEELFQRRVELVTPESLSPHIGPHILREVEYVDLAA
jgi:uncharacterized protein